MSGLMQVALYFSFVTSCFGANRILDCKAKPGCDIAQCDPTPFHYTSHSEVLDRNEYPITCRLPRDGSSQDDAGRLRNETAEFKKEMRSKLKAMKKDHKAALEKMQKQLDKAENVVKQIFETQDKVFAERTEDVLPKCDRSKVEKLLDELSALPIERVDFLNLYLAEYYIHLEKSDEAKKMIDAMKKIVTSSGLKRDKFIRQANELYEDSFYVRAMILFRIASDFYTPSTSSPDDLVAGIYFYTRKTYLSTKALAKAGGQSRKIGLEYGVEFLIQMYDSLKTVRNASPAYKALKEALSCNFIEYILGFGEEYEKRMKYIQLGIETLERQFGADASKYGIYGTLLHNSGINHFNLNELSEAEVYFVKAIEATGKATDFESEAAKQKELEHSKNRLKQVHEKLGKLG